MIRTKSYQTIVDNVLVRNGLIVNQLNIRTGTGEEVPQEIYLTSRQQYGLPEDAIVYCNFQQLYKVHPPVLKSWANVSENQVYASYLLLSSITNLCPQTYILQLDIEACAQLGSVAVTIPRCSREKYAKKYSSVGCNWC